MRVKIGDNMDCKTLVCTGGIGSGKSYVAKIFKTIGVPVYNSDNRTKELYNLNRDLAQKLIELLGEEIFENGVLRRDIMATKIFRDSKVLERVNNIVHPYVLEDFKEWRERRALEGDRLVLLESAIYLDSPVFKDIADFVMVITAPEEIRIERVMKRDGVPANVVRERISRQISEEERLSKADFTIFAGGKIAIVPQVIEVLTKVGYFN